MVREIQIRNGVKPYTPEQYAGHGNGIEDNADQGNGTEDTTPAQEENQKNEAGTEVQ